MRTLITLLFAALSLNAVGQVEYPYPYNPDGNNDGLISLNDLMDLLALYGLEYNAGVLATDSISAIYYTGEMDYWDCASSCVGLRGNWKMLDKDLVGSYKSRISENSSIAWLDVRNAPLRYNNGAALAPVVYSTNWSASGAPTNNNGGCFCQTRTRADIEDINLCEGLEDECGVCNGEGAIYECGCTDIPEGDCDCNGNQLDAVGVCGGDCLEDLDGDGVCNPVLGPCEGQGFVSYNGYDYDIVETADGRCWFAEDLATSDFSDGSPIPYWSNYTSSFGLSIDFAPPEQLINGAHHFYNFAAVVSEKGLCPTSWHVPSETEWQELMSMYDATSQTLLELIPNNNSGYVLPYETNGLSGLDLWANQYVTWNVTIYDYTGLSITYWTSDVLYPDRAKLLVFSALANSSPSVSFNNLQINYGNSARCIKD